MTRVVLQKSSVRSRRRTTHLAFAVAATFVCLGAAACGFNGLGSAPDDGTGSPQPSRGPDPGVSITPDGGGAEGAADATLPIDATSDAVVIPPPLSVTASAPPATLDLEVEGTLGWLHFGTTKNDEESFVEKATAIGLLPRFTVTGSTDVRTYEDNVTTFTWTNGAGVATQSGTRNGVYSKTGFPIFHLTRTVGTSAQRWVVYAGVYKCKAKLTVKLGSGPADPTAVAMMDNTEKGYARYVIEHRAPADATPLTLTWELTFAYDPNNSNVTLAAQTLAPIP